MVRRVGKGHSGGVSVGENDEEQLVLSLSLDEFGKLEPEMQDLLRAGVQNLSPKQRDELNKQIFERLRSQEAAEERRFGLWRKVRTQFEMLFSQVQTFVRGEKAPTRYTIPPLGQGENLEIWLRKMSKIAQSWRRGKRVDLTRRMTDDGVLTLYFDDFSELDTPLTFACRITREGDLKSVDYQPGQGELERHVGAHGREQLRAFFDLLIEKDRGQKPLLQRFARRLERSPQATKLPVKKRDHVTAV